MMMSRDASVMLAIESRIRPKTYSETINLSTPQERDVAKFLIDCVTGSQGCIEYSYVTVYGLFGILYIRVHGVRHM